MIKSITFVLPGYGGAPVGGVKVVYEYANCLAARGYVVNIIHSAQSLRGAPLGSWLKSYIRFGQRILDKSYLPTRWFELDRRVRVHWVPSLEERFIPDADAIVATAWMTAEWVADYAPRKGSKYYLIQHFENWAGPEERVLKTWSLPLKKIVISRWLAEIAEEMGEQYTYIPNGLDFNHFAIDTPIEDREAHHVMMLYHEQPWKGSKDGLQALEMVRRKCPKLRVSLFGVPRARDLPHTVRYFRMPRQDVLRNLYNSAAIFLAPSWAEGWPLPPAEAMMCGAAVVATDIGGHREYARDNVTALLGPPKDPETLAEKVVNLIQNPERRIQLAHSGNENIRQFTWARACDRFEQALSAAHG